MEYILNFTAEHPVKTLGILAVLLFIAYFILMGLRIKCPEYPDCKKYSESKRRRKSSFIEMMVIFLSMAFLMVITSVTIKIF